MDLPTRILNIGQFLYSNLRSSQYETMSCVLYFGIKEDEPGDCLATRDNELNRFVKSINDRFFHLVIVDKMLFCEGMRHECCSVCHL